MKYVLDTHTWIWWNANPDKLSIDVKELLGNPDRFSEILLSAISPWEFCKLIEKKRYLISNHPLEWIDQALKMTKLRLVPLTPAISYRSTSLPGSFHADPADQIIVATVMEENAILITKDGLIQNYPHLRTLW